MATSSPSSPRPSLIYNHRSEDEFFYHYTDLIKARKILSGGSLRLSPYIYTNDPKESKDWWFDAVQRRAGPLDDKYNLYELSQWLSSELKHRTKLLCCSRDLAPLTGDHIRDIFNRGFCRPRMWAHYADRFSGVCLVLDSRLTHRTIRQSLAEDSALVCGRVSYVDRLIVSAPGPHAFCIDLDQLEKLGRAEYPDWHMKVYVSELFFEKARDWRDECEVRWVTWPSTSEHIDFDLRPALKGIVYGEATPAEAIDEFLALTDGWELSQFRLTWKNASPWYDFHYPDRRLMPR